MKQIFIFTLSLFTIVCFGQTTKGKAELEKALAGNIDCQKSLGVYYSFGWEGFPKNAEKSFYWYKKAALQNDSEAQLCIAEYYRYGGPVVVNTKEAIYWYKRAADNAKNKEAKEDAIKAIKELGGEYQEANAFPLKSSHTYKIKRTFIGETWRDFDNNDGSIVYKDNYITINLGFVSKTYTLKQSPKPELDIDNPLIFSAETTCDGEEGKLLIIDKGKTITIEPVGFMMNMGYEVEE